MKTLRAIPMIFALVAFCATVQVAQAQGEAESTESVQAAQAQSGDNRPATLGDIRALRAETQALGRELRAEMTNMGQELRAQIQAINDTLHMAFLTMAGIFATVMVALVGLLWKSRTGNLSGSAAVFLIPVALAAALTVGAAIAAIV